MFQYESHLGRFGARDACIFQYNKVSSQGMDIHWHENLELFYVISGEIHVTTNHVTVSVPQRHIAVINSNYLHYATPDAVAEYYSLIIDKKFLNDVGFSIDTLLFERMLYSPKIEDSFLHIAQEFSEEKKYFQEQIKAEILNIIVELARCHTVSQQKNHASIIGRRADIIKDVLRFLQNHYKEPISVEDIATHVGYSRYYISHLFKECVNCTLVYYINHLRCNHAKALLVTNQCSVSDAAEQSGFENLSYFSKTYKNHMGISPQTEKNAVSNKTHLLVEPVISEVPN
ncbi:MAG: helix-turn-helix domain-containing protein [Ruminococcaceae bacterium]|nr:helix-turn-helix domain-containing protein [Oscillospiraceae bacterium]